MTRQKSDDRTVPDCDRKAVGSGGSFGSRGGKAVAVNQQDGQLQLAFVTADNPSGQPVGAVGEAGGDRSPPATYAVPKTKDNEEKTRPATMEGVVEGLEAAFEKVASNKGAPGPDRQTVAYVRKHLTTTLSALRAALLDGSYRPGDIRRVWIPKSGGGERGLGIPNVVQEATRAVLEPLWEPTFHPSSHGFRPGRSCHTAIAEAKQNVDAGYEWVVDIDLEKFFDRVHHQRLMARVATRVQDRRLLVLLGEMLKASVVLPEGVRVSTEEGVPQGGPLSPLLSNIVLDELDQELSRRGHRFVRYADDCNIYVRSERAGKRVMASVTHFIERRLRLKVNASKSAVALPETRHFLGYRLARKADGSVEVLLSERSEKRLRERIRELLPRSSGRSLDAMTTKINAYLIGWLGHFRVCTSGIEKVVRTMDAHIRRRLRAIVLKHWKRRQTIARRLIRLGISPKTAWRGLYEGRKSTWALTHIYAVDRGLCNAYFAKQGLVSLAQRFATIWTTIPAPRQLPLFAESERS